MKTEQNKRPVFQAILDVERQRKLRRIADYRGVPMSSQIRLWIDADYQKLPAEAKGER